MTRFWSDGIAQVEQAGRTVTVQILGDVYVTECSDTDEAATMFAAEVMTEQERGEVWDAGAEARREQERREWDRYAELADWWAEVPSWQR